MNSNLTKVDLYKAVLSDTKEIIGKSADKDLKKELFRLEKDLLAQIDLYKKPFANSNSKLFFSEFMINFLDKMENCLISFQEVPGIILAVDENDIYSSYAFLWGILYHCHISKIEDIKTFKYDNMAKFSEFLNKLGIFVKIKENYEKYVNGIINGEINLSKAKYFLSRLLENRALTVVKKKNKHRSKKKFTKKVEEKKEEKKEEEKKEVTNEPNEEKKEEDKIEVKKEKGEANKEKDEDQKEEDIEEDETKKKIKEYGEINEERGTENPEEKIEEEIKEETKEKENENEEDKESIKGKDDNSKETIKEGEDVFKEKEKEEKEEKEREDNNNINDNEKGNNNNLLHPQEETITHDQLVLIVKSLKEDLDSTKQKLFQHEQRIKNLEENQKLLFYQLSMYQARDISKNIYYYFCKYLKNSNGEKPFSDLLTIMDYFNKGGDEKYTPEQQKILRKFFRVIFFINKANNRILHNNLSSAVKEAIEKKKENDLLSLLPPNNYAQLFETLKNYLDLNLKNEQFQEALRYVYENAYIHDDKIEIIRENDFEAIKKENDSIKFLITKDEIDEAKKLFDVIKIGNETFEQVCNAKTYESSE